MKDFKKSYSLAGFKTLNNMLSDIGRGGVIVKDIIPKIFPDFSVFDKLSCQDFQQGEFFSKEKTPIFI